MKEFAKVLAACGGMAILCMSLCIGIGYAMLGSRVETKQGDAVAPVQCECSCPEQKCTAGQGIVADGYNVSITLDGTTKWMPPSLNPDENGYVVLCRREDPELINHPDYTMTRLYNFFHECLDDLATARSGFDDEVNQCCWQQEGF